MTARAIDCDSAGLRIAALGVHLDPHGAAERAFVSRAHLGGAAQAGGALVVMSAEALALERAMGNDARAGARGLAWDEAIELPVVRAFGGGTARVSIAPAGHMLGAAQLVVDGPFGRVVYAGATSRDAGATYAAPSTVACDELFVDATFALPIYRFPPRADATAALVAWCRERLAAGRSALVLAQTLGEAVEILAVLSGAGLALEADDDVFATASAYESLGVALGVPDGRVRAHAPPPKRKASAPRVVVLTTRARAELAKREPRADVAFASGAALVDAALAQQRADAGFVLSSHEDHPALVARVAASGARRVATAGADAAAFARILRDAGHDAAAFDVDASDGDADGGDADDGADADGGGGGGGGERA